MHNGGETIRAYEVSQAPHMTIEGRDNGGADRTQPTVIRLHESEASGPEDSIEPLPDAQLQKAE